VGYRAEDWGGTDGMRHPPLTTTHSHFHAPFDGSDHDGDGLHLHPHEHQNDNLHRPPQHNHYSVQDQDDGSIGDGAQYDDAGMSASRDGWYVGTGPRERAQFLDRAGFVGEFGSPPPGEELTWADNLCEDLEYRARAQFESWQDAEARAQQVPLQMNVAAAAQLAQAFRRTEGLLIRAQQQRSQFLEATSAPTIGDMEGMGGRTGGVMERGYADEYGGDDDVPTIGQMERSAGQAGGMQQRLMDDAARAQIEQMGRAQLGLGPATRGRDPRGGRGLPRSIGDMERDTGNDRR
jgi:hypothetical protein